MKDPSHQVIAAFNEVSLTPRSLRGDLNRCPISGIFGLAEAIVRQHDDLIFLLGDQIPELLIADVDGEPLPFNDLAALIDQPSEFVADNPTMVRQPFLPVGARIRPSL